MKKIVFSLLMVMCMPIMVKAQNFDVPSADMSLDIPDSWYTFTRDNLDGNTEIEDLGLTIDIMNEIMLENDVYVDALNEELEFLVYNVDTEDIGSLTNYHDFEIEDLGEELVNLNGADTYDIFKNDYKFVRVEYEDSGYYIIDYYTIVDDRAYTFSAQKESEFSDAEKTTVEEIMNSVYFDNFVPTSNDKETVIVAVGIGLVVVLGVVAIVIAKVKDKNESKENV